MKLLQYSHLLYLSTFNIFPDDNTGCHLFIRSFTMKYKKKNKT